MKSYLILFLIGFSYCLAWSQDENSAPSSDSEKKSFREKLPFETQGFLDTRHGFRLQEDAAQSKDLILSETRFQLQLEYWKEWAEFKIKTDFIYDSWQDEFLVRLREANVLLTPSEWFDLKIGRQILTWGKGDMLFINDLFPKDWQAFFIGRDLEYLKGVNDAAKLTIYFPWFEFNAIYVPQFDNDIFPDGNRLSFFDGFQGVFIGDDNKIQTDIPDDWFSDSEFHWRARKNIKGFDLALYGYYGYWKSPAGLDVFKGNYIFPRMYAHGASFEGNKFKGIFSIEVGHYYSKDDKKGDDFTINNSRFNFLIGHAMDFKKDFKIAFQYYAEIMMQYDALKDNFPTGATPPKQIHDMVTLRLTKLLNKQRLNLSLFSYYSISDNDGYLRPSISYKLNDNWKIETGGNLFFGENTNTFWSQFQNNNNVFAAIRRSF